MSEETRKILKELEVGTTYSGVDVICRQYKEIEKLNNIINELKERSLHYSEEIDRLLDIKEEVRKYMEKASYFQGNKVLNEKDILEILDKENK